MRTLVCEIFDFSFIDQDKSRMYPNVLKSSQQGVSSMISGVDLGHEDLAHPAEMSRMSFFVRVSKSDHVTASETREAKLRTQFKWNL